MIVQHKNIKIYFGNKTNPFYPNRYLEAHDSFEDLLQEVGAKNLTFLSQIHSSKCCCVGERLSCEIELFDRQGDALVSDVVGCGLGVLTADCLPVVLYDERRHVVSVVHAGWRGSVDGILRKTVFEMGQRFGTVSEDLVVFFGPSAGVCCYEVSEDFSVKECLVKRDNKLFFDNSLFNYLELLSIGVLKKNIVMEYNVCTICNTSYHSYRRDGVLSGRQATIVSLCP